MKVLEIILIALQLTSTKSRRKHPRTEELASSEESIENLLYYKDCKHQTKEPSTTTTTTTPPMPLRLRQPECPCPRMCCSMCCECGGGGMGGGNSMFGKVGPNEMMMGGMDGMSSVGRMGGMSDMGGMNNMLEPMGMPPHRPHQPSIPGQPPILRTKKKKKMFPGNMPGNTPGNMPGNIDMSMLPPIGARRGSGFTREAIKNLINQDEDIKKILKDLVKVTMSKVDLDGVAAAVPQPMPRRIRIQRRTATNNNKKNVEDYEDD